MLVISENNLIEDLLISFKGASSERPSDLISDRHAVGAKSFGDLISDRHAVGVESLIDLGLDGARTFLSEQPEVVSHHGAQSIVHHAVSGGVTSDEVVISHEGGNLGNLLKGFLQASNAMLELSPAFFLEGVLEHAVSSGVTSEDVVISI